MTCETRVVTARDNSILIAEGRLGASARLRGVPRAEAPSLRPFFDVVFEKVAGSNPAMEQRKY